MTNDELESSINSIRARLTTLERQLANLVGHAQLSGVMLVLESQLQEARKTIETLVGRVTTLEGTVSSLV